MHVFLFDYYNVWAKVSHLFYGNDDCEIDAGTFTTAIQVRVQNTEVASTIFNILKESGLKFGHTNH